MVFDGADKHEVAAVKLITLVLDHVYRVALFKKDYLVSIMRVLLKILGDRRRVFVAIMPKEVDRLF